MLDIMRRKKRLKAILWVVIFSLALGMLLFFVPGVNVSNVARDTSAATVNGETIAMDDFVAAYRRMVKQYSNRGQNRIDPETLRAMGLPKQVLDELISEKVLQAIADRFGVDVSENEVRRAIETYPYFQNQGRFIGIEQYVALLNSNDIPVEEFEKSMRQNQLVKKVRAIIGDSLDVSDQELKEEFSHTNEQTTVFYSVLKKDDFAKRVKPLEPELRAYFDGHKASYQVKEMRRAQYLAISVARMLPLISTTEQDILDEWNRMSHDEAVDAAHILFRVEDPAKDAEVKAKAEAVLKKVKGGESFAELAKKNSQDPGSANKGGELGTFQRGQMVKEFETAAFALKAGEISDLVHTQYGYHIIRVNKHETPTLESMRPRLMAAVQYKKAQELAKKKAEEAALMAGKNKDLNLTAKAMGTVAEVKETGLFQKDDTSSDFTLPQALREEVFSLKEINSIGKVVENPAALIIPKLVEVQLPKPGEFAQFKSQVEKDYIDSKAKELLQVESKKLSAAARKQGSLEKAAKELGLSVKTSQPFNISGTPDPEIGSNPSFNKAAFDLQPGGVSDPLPLLDNEAVLQVKSRSPFDEAGYQKQKAGLKTKLLQSSQDAYFQEYVRKVTEEFEKAGKIRINPKALEELPKSNY
jgi:peptidyl-prolyl cis-trans isomerase D